MMSVASSVPRVATEAMVSAQVTTIPLPLLEDPQRSSHPATAL